MPPEVDPAPTAGDEEPRVPPAVRRRVAQVAGAALAALTATVVAVAFLAPAAETGGPAPILVGHLAAQLVTLSWVFAAVLYFDAESGWFMGSTIGLAPFRLLVVALLLTAGSELFGLPLTPMGLSFVISYAAGHLVEFYVFNTLAAATSTPPEGA